MSNKRDIISTDNFTIELHKKEGSFDVLDSHGNLVVKNAFSSVQTKQGCFNTLNSQYKISQGPYEDHLGKGNRYRLDFERKDPSTPTHFELNIQQYEKLSFFTIELIIINDTKSDIYIENFCPMSLNAKNNGGLWVGNSPEGCLIYENGLGAFFEFFLRSYNAKQDGDSSMMEFIYSKKDIKQNFFAGLIGIVPFLAEIISNDEETEGHVINGKEAIAEWKIQITFPFPKILSPGESIASGVWLINLNANSGFDMLENYANVIRTYNNIHLWEHSIPHGWNSWGNPIAKYRNLSYVHDIDEKIVLDNLEVAVKNLKPFGLEYYQLDTGYSPQHIMDIDELCTDRFPHGMKYIADKIHEKGLKAGIWINPFNVGKKSKLIKLHEKDGWFPPPDPSFLIKNAQWSSLDVTIPEVQNYLRRFIRRVVKDWGFDLLKVDFSYLNMGPKEFKNKSLTASEIHRLGFGILKEEIGPDVFMIGIGGPIGLHLGVVDGERISLDTLPQWNDPRVPEHMFDVAQTEGSITFNYRNFARRFFLNNRVWYNHLDCLCFRPSLTRNESVMFASAMGLLCGIFKIGDKIVEMKPEDINVIQRMLPIYKGDCRPIDVFRTLLPEILHVPIKKEFKSGSYPWDIVGLFNWGANRDLINEKDIESQEKDIVLDLTELGLEDTKKYHIFDFWNEKYLGKFKKVFSSKIKPHDFQIISIHLDHEHPQFISSNRHLTQGGVELVDINWNYGTETLSGVINAVDSYEHRLFFYIPDTFTFKVVSIENATQIKTNLTNKCLSVSFVWHYTKTEKPLSKCAIDNSCCPIKFSLFF
jgi:hypothetical protein